MSLEDRIVPLLRKYRVQRHSRASRDAGATRYAVFTGSAEQLTEPARYSEASTDADRLTARDIAALMGGAG